MEKDLALYQSIIGSDRKGLGSALDRLMVDGRERADDDMARQKILGLS
jgi:hypothetical protein